MMAEAMGVNTLALQNRHLPDRRAVRQHSIGLAGCWRTSSAQSTPQPFGLKMGIEYLFMAVLGGAGYVWGAISRRTGLTKLLEDQLQVAAAQALIGTSGSYEVIVFGIVHGAGAEVPARRLVVAGRPLAARTHRRTDDWQHGCSSGRVAPSRHGGDTVLEGAGHPQAVRRPGGGERHRFFRSRPARSSA
jgi:branched-chain amino acid transport system permease protein